jgi:hypothetical protein
LNNITNIKISKTFKPTLASALKYTISFSNALFNPHSGHLASTSGVTAGGILSSTGFSLSGSSETWYLEDDGAGIVKAYYVSGTSKVYQAASVGTIDYTTGDVVLTKINITAVGDVDGATSTSVKIIVQPASNDVVPVRNQILQIDSVNLLVTGTADTIAAGAGDAGVNYTTSATY